jgi:ubiquinone biosynthesis protein UbiJ
MKSEAIKVNTRMKFIEMSIDELWSEVNKLKKMIEDLDRRVKMLEEKCGR